MKQPNDKQQPPTLFGEGSACMTLFLDLFFLTLASTKEHSGLYLGMGILLNTNYAMCGQNAFLHA